MIIFEHANFKSWTISDGCWSFLTVPHRFWLQQLGSRLILNFPAWWSILTVKVNKKSYHVEYSIVQIPRDNTKLSQLTGQVPHRETICERQLKFTGHSIRMRQTNPPINLSFMYQASVQFVVHFDNHQKFE